MHFGDSIFIFLLALVLFGPKKLPEIGRTIGKLLAEFRRASNEFKFQIQEELRNMEEDERRKKVAEQTAQKAPEALPAETSASAVMPTILPPSTGTPVSTGDPYATPVEPAEPAPASVTPSAAEVVVDPPATVLPASDVDTASATGAATDPPAHVDLTPHSNGAYPGEPVESGVPGETIHHG